MKREHTATGARTLEARFHPRGGAQGRFTVVAHVTWRGGDDWPSIEPALAAPDAPAMMLVKLHYLVASTRPESYARLRALESQFWSFAEVDGPSRASGRAAGQPEGRR